MTSTRNKRKRKKKKKRRKAELGKGKETEACDDERQGKMEERNALHNPKAESENKFCVFFFFSLPRLSKSSLNLI